MQFLLRNRFVVCLFYMTKAMQRNYLYCVKSLYIRSFSGSISPNSVRMPQTTDQKNSEYGHFQRSVDLLRNFKKEIIFEFCEVFNPLMHNVPKWSATP